jgi:hypothetical protein
MTEKGTLHYQPKGGMCAQCKHILRDCSHLKFSTMPVIGIYKNKAATKIVKCTDYKKDIVNYD